MAKTNLVEVGIADQADHVDANGAPGTAAICRSLIALMKGDSRCERRVSTWPDSVLRDAMPLRFAGGIHDLYRRGIEPGLGSIYRGEVTDQAQIDHLVADIVARHDDSLLSWFDGPPQTNESGRSSSFIAGLHWLAGRVVPHFELNEIGSSAGMNLLIERYRYDLADVVSGPESSALTIRPEWRGPPPPDTPFTITSIQGSDIDPIDVRDEAAANRLMAYVWPEAPVRFQRMEAGIAMIRDDPVNLVAADAADWVEMRLAQPQEPNSTRILMHSIVWQYLPDESQRRITAAMDVAGAAATSERPLAWLSLETNRATFRHELTVRYWPGDGATHLLGEAQAHGAWVNWF